MASDHFSTRDPTAGVNRISRDKFSELQLNSQAAVFTSIWGGDMDDNTGQQKQIFALVPGTFQPKYTI